MSSYILKSFIVRDLKLINKTKLVIFSLLLLLYFYVVYKYIMQTDLDGNMYIFGLGYASKGVAQVSITSIIATFVFLTTLSIIDLDENINVYYSIIACRVKVIYIFAARIIICMLNAIISFIIISLLLYLINYDLSTTLQIASNAILMTYAIYILLLYLLPKHFLNIALPIITVFQAIYLPHFLSTNTISIISISLLVVAYLYVYLFANKIFINKLRVESNRGDDVFVYNNFSIAINNVLENVSTSIYDALVKIIPASAIKLSSYLLLDSRRILKSSPILVILFLVKLFVVNDFIMALLLSTLFFSRLFIIQGKSFIADYWTYQQGHISSTYYIIIKFIIFAVFNVIAILAFNYSNINNGIILALLILSALFITLVLNVLIHIFKTYKRK